MFDYIAEHQHQFIDAMKYKMQIELNKRGSIHHIKTKQGKINFPETNNPIDKIFL